MLLFAKTRKSRAEEKLLENGIKSSVLASLFDFQIYLQCI